jgi:hypothetical protein
MKITGRCNKQNILNRELAVSFGMYSYKNEVFTGLFFLMLCASQY